MTISLDHLLLMQELDARIGANDPVARQLKAQLISSAPTIASALADIRIYFRHFTDHSITHSLRIIKNIGSILTNSQLSKTTKSSKTITNIDLFLIIGAALIHDIGMIISEEEFNSLILEEEFLGHVEKWKLQNEGLELEDWGKKGIPRLAISDYARKYHPQRSLRMVLDKKVIPDSLTEGSPKLADWLGKIAASHGMPLNEISDFPTRVEIQLQGGLQEECNPRFVAFCLRIGDLLDIGTARACPFLRHLSEPLSLISIDHWAQYENIEIRGLAPNREIEIAGTCPTQKAERILREWVSWLDNETTTAIAIQNQDDPQYGLNLGRIKYSVKPKKVNGKPSYEFLSFRFNLDEKMVFERLFGKSLYGRPELAIRELLQNAIDSHRALIVLDLFSKSNWADLNDDNRVALFGKKLSECRSRMPITVSLKNEKNESGQVIAQILSIQDHGIGMNRETIENYLLKIGRSRWVYDSSTSRLGIGKITIGTFGIGFLSALMLSENIVIESRSCLPNEHGIRATIYGWQGYLATEPLDMQNNGTKITIRLEKNMFKSDIEFACILAEMAPMIDFPVQFESDDLSTIIPQINTKSSKEQTTVSLDDDNSIVSMQRSMTNKTPNWHGEDEKTVAMLKSRNRQLFLCQDGIAVGEVSPPSRNEPEFAILRQHNLIVDLRGRSRVPLDLSRNLVESGHEDFWRTMVPKIWDALSKMYKNDEILLSLFGSLVDKEINAFKNPDPFRFINPKGFLLRGIRELDSVSQLTFIDAGTIYSQDIIKNEKIVAWLAPPPADDEILVGSMLDEEKYRFYNAKAIDRLADTFDLSLLQKLATRGDKEWRRLLKQFGFIAPGRNARCCLHKLDKAGTSHINNFVAFRITDNWLSIREPYHGKFTLLPYGFLAEYEQDVFLKGMSIADFYLFLMYTLYPIHDDWGNQGDFAGRLCEVQELINEIEMTGFACDQKEESGDYEEDDEIMENQQTVGDMIYEKIQRIGKYFVGIAAKVKLENSVPAWEVEYKKYNS